MSSHDIVVDAKHIERMAVARPSDHLLWESIEAEPGGRHALVLGSLDDALVLPGTLDELARVGDLITGHINTERERVAAKAAKKARKKVAKAAKRAAEQAPAEPTEIPGPAGSFITAFLRPGAELMSGGTLGEGIHGVRLIGDVELTGTGKEMGELADQLAARFVSERSDAVSHAADMMASAAEDNAWEGFNCGEVDGIAQMLAVHGHLADAGSIIAAHACDDDGGDPHGYIRALADWEKRQEAAEVYVRRMCGEKDAQPADAEGKRETLAQVVAQLAQLNAVALQLRQELGEPVEL